MTLDEELVEALEKDYTTAPITSQERVMLDYVVKLTQDATKCWKAVSYTHLEKRPRMRAIDSCLKLVAES